MPLGDERRDAGRALWLKERRAGIGGSDAAAILGISKYAGALDVWLDKTTTRVDSITSEAAWWGSAMEDLLARRYMEKTGRRVWKPDHRIAHPDHPEIIGTPDRLVFGQRRGLELKTADSHLAGEWGREGTDQIPHHYAVQCMIYMAVTGFPAWDCAVLIGGNDFRIYTLWRDEDFERAMIAKLVAWWHEYVVPRKRPPVDLLSAKAIELIHFANTDANMLEPTAEAATAAASYVAAGDAAKQAENDKELAANQLKAIIGDATGIAGDGWKATWKLSKPIRKVDWDKFEGLIGDAMAREIGDAMAARFMNAARDQATVETPGQRRFRCVKIGESNAGAD